MVVDQFVDALLTPIDYEITVDSWLTIKPWAEAFLASLRGHHALEPAPLGPAGFEAAFDAACRAAGWPVAPARSATHRFFDTVVTVPGLGDIRLSLKTTAAQAMRPNVLHISKLTEAAWIQDARTQAGRRDKIVELFREYREQTDSIIILRCFRQGGAFLLYELIELPTQMFASVEQLGVAEAQAATIPIPPGERTGLLDARIRIDRSDAKITITGIRIELCTIHGRWAIPTVTEEP